MVAACGFLPLAIRIAASRLAARRTWTVSVLAAKLADERRRLDELQAGDLAVKATFELGYGQLEPAQARAFRLLGLADGPDISLAAAAAVLDLPGGGHRGPAGVPGRHLAAGVGGARPLPLPRPGAALRACVCRAGRAAAERAGGGAVAAAGLLPGHGGRGVRDRAARGPAGGPPGADRRTRGCGFDDRHAAQDWLYTEANCLLACVRQCRGAAGTARGGPSTCCGPRKDLSESGANSKRVRGDRRAVRDAAQAARRRAGRRPGRA